MSWLRSYRATTTQSQPEGAAPATGRWQNAEIVLSAEKVLRPRPRDQVVSVPHSFPLWGEGASWWEEPVTLELTDASQRFSPRSYLKRPSFLLYLASFHKNVIYRSKYFLMSCLPFLLASGKPAHMPSLPLKQFQSKIKSRAVLPGSLVSADSVRWHLNGFSVTFPFCNLSPILKFKKKIIFLDNVILFLHQAWTWWSNYTSLIQYISLIMWKHKF